MSSTYSQYPTIPGTTYPTSSPITLTAKDPEDIAEYKMDFSNIIYCDTLTGTPNVTITPAGLTIIVVDIINSSEGMNKAVGIHLMGGTAGVCYTIKVEVQTTNGDTFARSMILPVQNR